MAMQYEITVEYFHPNTREPREDGGNGWWNRRRVRVTADSSRIARAKAVAAVRRDPQLSGCHSFAMCGGGRDRTA